MRAALAALAVLAGLALAEGGLRLAAGAARWTHRPAPPTARRAGVVRILCLGESTTAKTVPRDHSWPAQLVGALARRGVRAETFNLAVAGTNTGALLERLPAALRDYRPDLVVAMAGINDNYWFSVAGASGAGGWRLPKVAAWAYHSLRGDRPAPAAAPDAALGWGKPVMDIDPPGLRRTRCWKAAFDGLPEAYECALAHARGGTRAPSLYGQAALVLMADGAPADSIARAKTLLAAAAPLRLEHPRLFEAQAALARREGRLEEAARLLRRAVALSPTAGWVYGGLIEVLAERRQFGEAAAVFGMFRASGARDARTLVAMQKVCLETGDQACVAALGDELLEYLGKPIDGVRMNARAPDTAENLRRMAALARESGAVFVAMQYPRSDPRQLEAIYRDLDVPVVANVDNFTAALAHARYEDLFVDRFRSYWGHATPAGDLLIAESLASALVSKGLANPKKP